MSLLEQAIAYAEKNSDGHFTLCRFTTNWRAGFFTPETRYEIEWLTEGKTMDEAIENAIAQADLLGTSPPSNWNEDKDKEFWESCDIS